MALSLPSSGLKSTIRESLTAKTESSFRYAPSLAKIWVVIGMYSSCVVLCRSVKYVKPLLWDETYDQVDMSRAIWVPVQQLQDLARRTVIWDRIRRWLEAVEGILAILVGGHSSSQVAVLLVWVLLLVESVGGSLPGIDYNAWDWRAGQRINDLAVHIGDMSVIDGVFDDSAAVGDHGCVVAEEGAKNGGRGVGIWRTGSSGKGDLVDETGGR